MASERIVPVDRGKGPGRGAQAAMVEVFEIDDTLAVLAPQVAATDEGQQRPRLEIRGIYSYYSR